MLDGRLSVYRPECPIRHQEGWVLGAFQVDSRDYRLSRDSSISHTFSLFPNISVDFGRYNSMRNMQVLKETVIRFSDSQQVDVSYQELRYWAKTGLLMPNGSRVTLDYAKRGGGLVTSHEALDRFWERTNAVEGEE